MNVERIITLATYIDFQKAFDCVDRIKRQGKLQLKRISGKKHFTLSEPCIPTQQVGHY